MAEFEITDEAAELLAPETFRRFYERGLPVVYGYLLRRCGGREDVAMDLTQQTFLSAVRSLRSGAEVNAPIPWLVSIARRRLVDHYRREEVRRRPHPVPNPLDTSLWTGEHEGDVVAALDQIPSHYRLALILRYVDDRPTVEVAELLDRSVAATESLLARARAAFAEAYEGHRNG